MHMTQPKCRKETDTRRTHAAAEITHRHLHEDVVACGVDLVQRRQQRVLDRLQH
jgi:hypothetical protein